MRAPARDPGSWLATLARMLWPLFLGASLLPVAGAFVLAAHRAAPAAVLIAAVTAPYVVVKVTLLSTLSVGFGLARGDPRTSHLALRPASPPGTGPGAAGRALSGAPLSARRWRPAG